MRDFASKAAKDEKTVCSIRVVYGGDQKDGLRCFLVSTLNETEK
jgi:hypothetical protein